MFQDKILKSVAEAVKAVMDEALKGDQHKIDKNKNGKVDAHDFKLLRKEEAPKKPASPFDWKNTPRQTAEKGEKTGHDSKKISTGTVYTKRYTKEEASQAEFNAEIKKAQDKSIGKVKADVAKPAVQAVKQESVEQIDELSKNTLKSYSTKAKKDSEEYKRAGYSYDSDPDERAFAPWAFKKAASRAAGAAKADSKIKESVQQIKEGRPSQSHPLEGHDYHKKTDAELKYIAKDAHEAAEAMKSHNTTAENKYRDQANDSATVRYWRQKNGTPDWYKKKYGHIKEEVEHIEERSLSTGEKAAMEKNVKGMKKNLAGFKERYGKDAKSVMYATATKAAKKD